MLKEMGLSEPIINAMLKVTSSNMKKTSGETAALKNEIERLKATIDEMKARQNSPAREATSLTPASRQNPGGGVGDAVINCAARLAALEACNHAPGGVIGQSICRAADKSQFPCN